MRLLRSVEGGRGREAFVAGPEGALVLLGVRIDDPSVLWEGGGQVDDLVPEEEVEVVKCDLPRTLQRARLRRLQQRQQAAHLEDRLRIVGAGLALGDEGRGVLRELLRLPHRLDEEELELVASPLDAMVGKVREVPQSAHRDAAALVRLPAVAVGLRLERHNRVNVACRTHGPALEQRLFVLDALVVDVKARLHVVQGVADAVQVHPKVVVEGVLSLGPDEHFQRLNLHPRVHDSRHLTGSLALRLADVVLPEQKLPSQVRQLDAVGVGDCQQALWATTHAIERVVLQELAAQRSATDHEVL
mmetsp:Transcript_126726/g.366812  ORF Transcript_126726/g.366812 Transcript_126726/m.366812 type:complete len:302 (-) Transcript_126726:1433-2338(-)